MKKYETGLILISLVIFFVYVKEGVTIHFFNHLFPALWVGFLALIVLEKFYVHTGRVRLLLPFLVWMYSIVPELFVGEAGSHPEWTNACLLHEWFDHLLNKSYEILFLNGLLAVIFSLYYFLKIQKR